MTRGTKERNLDSDTLQQSCSPSGTMAKGLQNGAVQFHRHQKGERDARAGLTPAIFSPSGTIETTLFARALRSTYGHAKAFRRERRILRKAKPYLRQPDTTDAWKNSRMLKTPCRNCGLVTQLLGNLHNGHMSAGMLGQTTHPERQTRMAKLSMWRLHQLVIGVLGNKGWVCGVPRGIPATLANSHRAHTLWFQPMPRLIANICPLLLSVMLTLICSSPAIIQAILYSTSCHGAHAPTFFTIHITGTEAEVAQGRSGSWCSRG